MLTWPPHCQTLTSLARRSMSSQSTPTEHIFFYQCIDICFFQGPEKRPETYHKGLRDCYFDAEDNRCSHSSPLPPVLDMNRLLTLRTGCRDTVSCFTCSSRFHPTKKLIKSSGMLVEPTSGCFLTRRDLSHVLGEG